GRGGGRAAGGVSRAWIVILGAGAGTFAMRASFIAFAHRLATVPPGVQRLLRQIPPAALAALVLPAIVRPHGVLDLTQPRMAGGVLATFVAWRTGSVALTLIAGMATVVLLDAL
ncbi:MAG: AzlD domain-containing protein, partial [Acidimicrobiia bacterium]